MEILLFPSWNYNGNCSISIWKYCYSHHGIITVIVVFKYGNLPFPSWNYNGNCSISIWKYSIPTLELPLYLFYSLHGLCYIPIVYLLFPLWVEIYSHCVSSIPIMGYVSYIPIIFYSIAIMGPIIFIIFPSWVVRFPLYIFYSHYGLGHIPIVYLLFPLWVV